MVSISVRSDELEHLEVRDLIGAGGSWKLSHKLLDLVIIKWAVSLASTVFDEETHLNRLEKPVIVAIRPF